MRGISNEVAFYSVEQTHRTLASGLRQEIPCVPVLEICSHSVPLSHQLPSYPRPDLLVADVVVGLQLPRNFQCMPNRISQTIGDLYSQPRLGLLSEPPSPSAPRCTHTTCGQIDRIMPPHIRLSDDPIVFSFEVLIQRRQNDGHLVAGPVERQRFLHHPRIAAEMGARNDGDVRRMGDVHSKLRSVGRNRKTTYAKSCRPRRAHETGTHLPLSPR